MQLGDACIFGTYVSNGALDTRSHSNAATTALGVTSTLSQQVDCRADQLNLQLWVSLRTRALNVSIIMSDSQRVYELHACPMRSSCRSWLAVSAAAVLVRSSSIMQHDARLTLEWEAFLENPYSTLFRLRRAQCCDS